MDYSTSKVISKKVLGNNLNFSPIEITSGKVRGNNVDFLISEITAEKYVEMTLKFVEIWSLMFRRNVGIESTWSRRGVPIGNCQFTKLTSLPW